MIEKEVEVLFQRLHSKICCVKKDLGDLLSEDVKDALNNSLNPSLTNVFLTEENLNNYLSQDILDALQAATTPTLANPYATMLDLMGIEPGTLITVVANYSALPPPATVTGKFYWAAASQGIPYTPDWIGGAYYQKGMYYSNGVTWEYTPVPFQATQAEVNTGTNNDRFVTPLTLKMSTQWDGVVLLGGRAGGQTIIGGTGAGENLTLMSNGSGTKGAIIFGDSRYNESTNRLILGTATGTGRINLPDAGTTAADGIFFGTSISLHKTNNFNLQLTPNVAFDCTSLRSTNTGLISTTLTNFAIGGATLTGSAATSALSITQTWNTTGNPTAINVDILNTASGPSANFLDFKLGGVSQIRISKFGLITIADNPQIDHTAGVFIISRAGTQHIRSSTVGTVIGTSGFVSSARLAVVSTTQGFLPPVMTATQASAIASPAQGLMLFVTNTNATFTAVGWWGWNGSAWAQL